MEKSKNKIFKLMLLILMLLVTIKLPVLGMEGENEIIIIQKAQFEFIIYYENICNKEFQFAFSNDAETVKEDLNFINSSKDRDTEDYLNIAYINNILYNQHFKSGDDTYIWIKVGDNYLKESEKIDLKKAISKENISEVEGITQRISVDATGIYEINKEINDINTKIITGKIVINSVEGSKYYYQLVKILDD